MGRCWKNFEVLHRKCFDSLEEMFDRNPGVKLVLERSQKEMRSMLLETGGKVILVTNWHYIFLVFSC